MKSHKPHPLEADVAALQREGLSYIQIGYHLGISRNAVASILNRYRRRTNAPKVGGRPAKLTPEMEEQFLVLYRDQRLPASTIAERFGLHEQTVRYALHRLGMERLKVGRRKKPRVVVPIKAKSAPAPVSKEWCSQCERLVAFQETVNCTSQFCKARPAVAA